MTRRFALGWVAAGLAAGALLTQPLGPAILAQGTPAVALRGHVSSADERAMEGVIVTAKKAGTTIATSVVTDARGEFQFSGARLEPGSYSLRIRAAGYDLSGAATVTIEPGRTAASDLTLEKTKNLS